MDAATIISAVVTQSGTDASRPTILSILNERYAQQTADSQWLLETTTIGVTTAGISNYQIPSTPEIVEILGLKVGGFPWDRIGQQDMWDVQASSIVVAVTTGGVYCPDYDASGGQWIVLYPTPTTSNLLIQALAAVLPVALTDSALSVPRTPSDMHGALIDGTTALILRRIDERPDLAEPYEQTFAQATEKMRRRKNSLVRGRGPVQIAVAGYHWDNT